MYNPHPPPIVQNEQTALYSIEQSLIGNDLQSPTTDIGEKPTHQAPPIKQPRRRDELFDKIAEVCQVDPCTAGPTIAKVKVVLSKATPPYTPDEVARFGKAWWEWPERKVAPTVWQLQERIGSVRAKKPGGNHAVSERRRPSPEILP